MKIANKLRFLLVVIIVLASSFGMKGQEMTEKQKAYQENKVELFTPKERDNTQMWVQEQIGMMELSEEASNDYSIILLYYLAKIRRLDDKDNFTSKAELLQKTDELVMNQNKEVKEILSEKQYEIHLEFYDKMNLMRKNRITETDFD